VITEHITAYHYMDARHMLEDAGLTPLRIIEVQSTEDDEDLITPMFLKDRHANLPTVMLFFFLLMAAVTLSLYGLFSLLNYLYAILIQ